jgi:hypothetical protein
MSRATFGSCEDTFFEAQELARPDERSVLDVGDGTALALRFAELGR